ncbi:hypothetical protein ACVWYF_003361 [Hymenobacter sp. UYAg731]
MKHCILLLLCWFSTRVGIAQHSNTKAQVYSAYFSEFIFQYDSVYHKRIENVVLMPLDSGRRKLDFDIEYLRDYLNGNLENNEIYKTYVQPKGWEPLSWLSYPWGIGQILIRDRQVGEMLIRLNSVLKEKHQIPQVEEPHDKFIRGNQYGFKHDWNTFKRKGGWTSFYKKYKHCYGIVELSDVVFSLDGQRAVFFVQQYRGDLDGWGGAIFMKKTDKGWEEDLSLQFWIS